MMTSRAKYTLWGLAAKYGPPAVAAVVLYLDFARPLAIEHRNYLSQSVAEQQEHSRLLREIQETQKMLADTLRRIAQIQAEEQAQLERLGQN